METDDHNVKDGRRILLPRRVTAVDGDVHLSRGRERREEGERGRERVREEEERPVREDRRRLSDRGSSPQILTQVSLHPVILSRVLLS